MTIASEKRLTEIERKKLEEEKKVQEREKARLKKAFCECFATESGKTVLKWIMEQCAYQTSEIVVNPQTGEINEKAALYNAIRRTLYTRIRKFLHRDILAQVEIGLEGADGSEDLLT